MSKDRKTCPKCKRELVIVTNFYKDRATKDGFRSVCIQCVKKDQALYREKRRNLVKELTDTIHKLRAENEKLKEQLSLAHKTSAVLMSAYRQKDRV